MINDDVVSTSSTYSSSKINELLSNSSTNIQGGEYIDVIKPKGETLYEYNVADVMESMGIVGCNNMFLTTSTFDYTGINMNDFTPMENRISDLYGMKIDNSYIQYLIPALKSDGTQYRVNEIISDSYFELAKSNLPNENFETIDDALLYAYHMIM